MTLLNSNSRGAERQRGCLFAETFRTQARVESNGGTVAGTPTFDPTTGVTLNGTTDYVSYDGTGNDFDLSSGGSISFFMMVDNVALTAFPAASTISATNKWGFKIVAGALRFRFLDAARSVSTTSASLADNTLYHVLVTYDGAARPLMYINGVAQSGTSGATISDTVASRIGSDQTGGVFFGGKVREFKVFSQLLTAAEALDYYNETTWTWRPRALVELPMLNANVSGTTTTNEGTLGSAADATYGAAGAAPTKETWRRGYGIDSGDTLTISDSASLRFDAPTLDFSLAAMVALDASAAEQVLFSKLDGANDGYELLLQADNTVRLSLNATDIDTTDTVADTSIHTVIVSVDRTGLGSIYIDGRLSNTGDASGITMATTADLVVGNRTAANVGVDGWISEPFVYDFVVTQLQVNDIHRTMMREINQE